MSFLSLSFFEAASHNANLSQSCMCSVSFLISVNKNKNVCMCVKVDWYLASSTVV